MDINPRDVINEARQAVTNRDFAVALEKYQWFFNNSIQIEPSFYGVRFSYCLDEWAELGNKYPVAKESLIKQKEQSLQKFLKTSSYQDFHEYSAIARYLGSSHEVFQEFLHIQNSNPKLAEDIFTHVYEYCAANNMWDLCKRYLGDAQSQYERELKLFGHMIDFAKEKESHDGQSLYESAYENFKKEILKILIMLHHTNSSLEYDAVQAKIESDLKAKNMEFLYLEIKETFIQTSKQ